MKTQVFSFRLLVVLAFSCYFLRSSVRKVTAESLTATLATQAPTRLIDARASNNTFPRSSTSQSKAFQYSGTINKMHDIRPRDLQKVSRGLGSNDALLRSDTGSMDDISAARLQSRNTDLTSGDIVRRMDLSERWRRVRTCIAFGLTPTALQISILLEYLLENLAWLSHQVSDLWTTLSQTYVFPVGAGGAVFGFIFIWTECSLDMSGAGDKHDGLDIIRNVSLSINSSFSQPYTKVKATIPMGNEVASFTIETSRDSQGMTGNCGGSPPSPSRVGEKIIIDGNTTSIPSSSSDITSDFTPAMRNFSNRNRLVITRYDYLESKALQPAIKCLKRLLVSVYREAEPIAKHWADKGGLSSWLSTGVFFLEIWSSDGSTLSADHFKSYASTMTRTIKAGFIGTFAGYMFIDMPFVLHFDIYIGPRRGSRGNYRLK